MDEVVQRLAYDVKGAFPRALTVNEVIEMRSTFATAGWKVIAELIRLDAIAMLCRTVDLTLTDVQRRDGAFGYQTLIDVARIEERLRESCGLDSEHLVPLSDIEDGEPAFSERLIGDVISRRAIERTTLHDARPDDGTNSGE